MKIFFNKMKNINEKHCFPIKLETEASFRKRKKKEKRKEKEKK